MAETKLALAIRIVMGRAEPATEDGIKALRFLISTAKGLLEGAECDVYNARKSATRFPSSAALRTYAPSPKAILREKAFKAALSLFDTVMVQGQAIGDVWYHDLERMRSESQFAASLADQLLRHTIPNGPCRVRDMVNQRTLAEMVKRAQKLEPVA